MAPFFQKLLWFSVKKKQINSFNANYKLITDVYQPDLSVSMKEMQMEFYRSYQAAND